MAFVLLTGLKTLAIDSTLDARTVSSERRYEGEQLKTLALKTLAIDSTLDARTVSSERRSHSRRSHGQQQPRDKSTNLETASRRVNPSSRPRFGCRRSPCAQRPLPPRRHQVEPHD